MISTVPGKVPDYTHSESLCFQDDLPPLHRFASLFLGFLGRIACFSRRFCFAPPYAVPFDSDVGWNRFVFQTILAKKQKKHFIFHHNRVKSFSFPDDVLFRASGCSPPTATIPENPPNRFVFQTILAEISQISKTLLIFLKCSQIV